MQAVKEKIQDIKESRKVKAEIKAQEKAEKELAKARLDIAREVRLAKEAEADMDKHVAKAGEIAEKEIAKHSPKSNPTAMSSAEFAPMEPAGSTQSATLDATGDRFYSAEAGAGRSAAASDDRPIYPTN